MSSLEIRRVNPESPNLLSNLEVRIDGVVIEHVEQLELWVGQRDIARVALTFAPQEISISADVLTTLKIFIDKELGYADAEVMRGAKEIDSGDTEDSGKG